MALEEQEMKTTVFEKVRIEEGLHEAVFKECKEISPGKHGTRVAMVFNVGDKELGMICYYSAGWGSRFGETLKALGVDHKEGLKINQDLLDSLKGVCCRVMVEDYKDTEGDTRSGITKVKLGASAQEVEAEQLLSK